MKIAFATIGDTRDIRRGSGTPWHLWQSLLKAGVDVHLVGPLDVPLPLPTRFFKWIGKLSGKRYASYRDPFMGTKLGKVVEKALDGADYDLLLTNDFCIAGYTRIKKPIVLFTDDTFPRKFSINAHWKFEDLSFVSVFFCQKTTRQGLRNADKCLFASHFAADSAAKYSHQDSYNVIPYGANISGPDVEIERSVDKIKSKGRVDLLFVGKDWEGKGGPVAVETARLLNARDIVARLHIVGVDSAEDVHEEYIHFYGLLNKNLADEKEQLETLYQSCDVLIVPSKAEGYGLVFVEAAAYGMPSLAYASTGVLTAVKDGVSGVLLNQDKWADAFADSISEWLALPALYRHLSSGAREFYETNANWSNSVKQLITELQNLLDSDL